MEVFCQRRAPIQVLKYKKYGFEMTVALVKKLWILTTIRYLRGFLLKAIYRLVASSETLAEEKLVERAEGLRCQAAAKNPQWFRVNFLCPNLVETNKTFTK